MSRAAGLIGAVAGGLHFVEARKEVVDYAHLDTPFHVRINAVVMLELSCRLSIDLPTMPCSRRALSRLDVGFMVGPYAARALRSCPTFQAVTRSESFLGAGKVPRPTIRQIVAAEHP